MAWYCYYERITMILTNKRPSQIAEVNPEIQRSVKDCSILTVFNISFYFDRHQKGAHLHQKCVILTRRYRHLERTVAPHCPLQDAPLVQ